MKQLKKAILFLSLLFTIMVTQFFASAEYIDPVTPDPAQATLLQVPGGTIQIVNASQMSQQTNCDSAITEYAFYENNPVSMKVQSTPQGDNKRIVTSSRLLKSDTYGIFTIGTSNDVLLFPAVSNIVPSFNTTNSKIVVVDVSAQSMFKRPSTPIPQSERGKPAAQLVSNMHYQSISTASTGGAVNYIYQILNAANTSTVNINSNRLIQNIQQTSTCFNYYYAYCGDGTVDGSTSNGIQKDDGSTIAWHAFVTQNNRPAEVCDDGALNGQAGKCKTDCSGIGGGVETGSLVVTKTLTIDQNYTPGDNVQFRINISNPSTQTVQNIAIEDYFLPSGFEYISSEINSVTGPSYFSTGINSSGAFYISYTGFSLAAGQNGYILINAKFLSCNDGWNHVFWSATTNGQTINGYTNKQVSCSTTPVSITKIANSNNVQLGQIVGFSITANNTTPNTITDVRVEDVWPTCFSLVAGSVQYSLPATQTQNGNLTQWTLSSGLPAGSTFTVTFSGQASTSASCIGVHTNIGRILYTDPQGTHQQPTTATVTITQATAQMEITKEVIESTAGPGDDVEFIIRYRNSGTTPINGFRIIDHRPRAIQFRTSILKSTGGNIDNRIINNTNPNAIIWNFADTVLPPGQGDEIRVIGTIKPDLQ